MDRLVLTSTISFLICAFFPISMSSPLARIVGGAVVQPNSVPYQISVQLDYGYEFRHYCGGSLIKKNVVLTAAHCTDGFTSSHFRVVAAEHNLTQVSGLEITLDVIEIKQHPGYQNFLTRIEKDVSLLILESDMPLSDTVALVPLPTQGQNSTGKANVTGWGAEGFNGEASDVLMSVELDVLEDDECRTYYGNTTIFDYHLCIGNLVPNFGACHGDSGGPAVCSDSSDNMYQCGIVSFGTECSRTAYPDVFTEVSHFVDWITANM